MSQSCLFCDNTPGSREHLWPAWIHKRRDFGLIRMQRGTSAEVIVNPEQKVRTVCSVCNNGWMSKLEQENIPLIGSMFQDLSIPLNEAQQHTVAAWAVKTAMMFDSTKGRNSDNRFYTKSDGVGLRVNREIPNLTRIWIGRMSSLHLNHAECDIALLSGSTRIGTASVSTIAAGHFAAQVVTIHPGSELAKQPTIELYHKPRDWDNMLLSIWPIERPTVIWPPKISF
jgi:hypothetical protein